MLELVFKKMLARERLRDEYARLLGVPSGCFDVPGLTIVETAARAEAEWANWLLPVWLVRFADATVCAVAPSHTVAAREAFADLEVPTLMHPDALVRARRAIDAPGWQQCEILVGYEAPPSDVTLRHRVERLRPGDPVADALLRRFDGGVFAIRDECGGAAAFAGIKDKGAIREIAVTTEPDHQGKGFGGVVVAEATRAILDDGNIPVYVPDSIYNVASYALAVKVGFEKAGEMLCLEQELPDWEGFNLLGAIATPT
jgi:GNAT superfamily N-acetyltransferase